MKITLANGMVLEGSSEQIVDVMEKMGISGDDVFYRSESKGLLVPNTKFLYENEF